MALPVVGGIMAFLVSAFQVLMMYRLVVILYRVTVRLAIFAIIVTVFLAVLTSIYSLMDGLSTASPTYIGWAYSWLVPSNFVPCVSAIATVQLAAWAWHWKVYAIDYASKGVS